MLVITPFTKAGLDIDMMRLLLQSICVQLPDLSWGTVRYRTAPGFKSFLMVSSSSWLLNYPKMEKKIAKISFNVKKNELYLGFN